MSSRTALIVRAGALVLLLIAAGVAAAAVGVPSQQQLRHTADSWGWWAPVAFAGLYAAVTLTPLPKTVFTIAAGAVFGIAAGLAAVLAGAVLGAILAYLLARALGKEAVQRLAGHRLDRFDAAVARRGFAAVLAARLIPVLPFTTINYLAGLTRIRLGVFTAATALGIVPATTAYVVLGAYDTRPGAWPFWAAIGTLAVLTAATAIVGLLRRQRAGPD